MKGPVPLYKLSDYERIVPDRDTGLETEPYRTPFRKDYARLLHSASFRRLQGKTQLFPGIDSDFFRNRLTHSLEVAQVAKSIATRLNATVPYFSAGGNGVPRTALDTDLVELAALAHDLGHPPFGHNGEDALDHCMRECGGFEGNAQTLRILSRLEKKCWVPDGDVISTESDPRAGLNLCMRSLAAVLKYDHPIAINRQDHNKPQKGYYHSEIPLVAAIKKAVCPEGKQAGSFQTIECKIMDIADDIAYSTYDLEDALKAQFVSPLDFISKDTKFLKSVAIRCNQGFTKRNVDIAIEAADVGALLTSILESQQLFEFKRLDIRAGKKKKGRTIYEVDSRDFAKVIGLVDRSSKNIQQIGFERTKLTSYLVGRFIQGISADIPATEKDPALTSISINPLVLMEIEVLKNFTYEALINSPRLRLLRYRGYQMVVEIFKALTNEKRKGFELLPDDFRDLYLKAPKDDRPAKHRIVCDFIAGMTDHYASEFYARLKSENPRTVFKPH